MASRAGRFAPSPSGDLHLGNLRTALVAWLYARSTGRRFVVRIDDLDRPQPGAEDRQLADLETLGIEWDEPVQRQSTRLARYSEVIEHLVAIGRTYECFCTRREILNAPRAPHEPEGAYPKTCRDLTESEREQRRLERPAALRLRTDSEPITVFDELHGEIHGVADDLVLMRGDGTPAYNLTVVVDDADTGVDQVVRGDDLLPSTPRQVYLAQLLGLEVPRYLHVPLVLSDDGERLAKSDGGATLQEQFAAGRTAADLIRTFALSLGHPPVSTAAELLEVFDPAKLPTTPWTLDLSLPRGVRTATTDNP